MKEKLLYSSKQSCARTRILFWKCSKILFQLVWHTQWHHTSYDINVTTFSQMNRLEIDRYGKLLHRLISSRENKWNVWELSCITIFCFLPKTTEIFSFKNVILAFVHNSLKSDSKPFFVQLFLEFIWFA